MVRVSRFSLIRKSIFTEIFGDRDAAYFWDAQFLPGWLPVILGVVLGIGSAVLIVNGLWHFLFPLVLAIPAAILFIRYPFVAVLIWILVFPFFVREPSAAGRFIYWVLHRAMIPAALGSVILSDWLEIRKREPVRFGRAELAMLLFLLLVLTNIVLLTPDPAQEFIRFYDRLFIPFCMYWLVRLAAPTEKDLKRLVWVGFITVLAQSLLGIIGWFAPQMLLPQWLGRAGERTVGTFGNPAVYTSTLLFLSLLLFQYGMQSKSRWIRLVSLFTLSLTFFCVFLSFSRGSWLGGLLVLVGLMFVYPKVVLRLTFAGLVLMLILGSTVLSDQIAFAYQRLFVTESAEGRVLGAASAIRMVEEKPWLGWGFGAYDLYDEEFKTRLGNITVRETSSHNTYLLILVEMGLISLLFYMFPVVWWLMLSRKVWGRLPENGFWSWRLLAVLWLLMLDHFTVGSFMEMIQSNLFGTTIWWLALALIANLVYPYLKLGDIGVPRWAYQPAQQVRFDRNGIG
jgi:O-antigen ligase